VKRLLKFYAFCLLSDGVFGTFLGRKALYKNNVWILIKLSGK
jgi:hypothetical protein